MTPDPGNSPPERQPMQWVSVGLLFVGSGCAALIYEVVWFHLLRLVIGASSISLGIVLASFMGGMCIGSLACPLLVSARFHPLRVYAALELGIGLFGCTLPWWLPSVGDWYLASAHEGAAGMVARATVAGVCLLPPTILMGATLPAIARWIKATPEGLARLGVFYGANTLGAVLGCVLAGFILLPQTDVMYSSYVAAAINALVALAALAIAGKAPYEPVAETVSPSRPVRAHAPAIVCVIIGLSGSAALGAEVVWTRMLSLLFGVTVYSFAIVLAVFLAGIGLGSAWAAKWAKKTPRPIVWLALCQLAIACLVPLVNFTITRVIPFWERPVETSAYNVAYLFVHDTMRASAAALPAALLWGASFSLALAAARTNRADAAPLTGQLYAANTLGAILGSLIVSMVLLPWMGSQRTQQAIALVSGLAAALAVFAQRRGAGAGGVGDDRPDGRSETATAPAGLRTSWLVAAAAVAIALVAGSLVAPLPHGFLASATYPENWNEKFAYRYAREGRHAPVVVQEHLPSGSLSLWISGKIVASTSPVDMRTIRMLGHLPALVHGSPTRTLTVGLGTGSTAGCFVLYPTVEEIRICEIEPAVIDAARNWFAEQNHGVLEDPRTRLTIDDARHYLATVDGRFDIITSDPIHPWVRGAAALYSTRYYECCKEHLAPGGVVVQWIPLYDADLATVKCQLATFVRAFPHTMLWTSWQEGDGPVPLHDMIALGSLQPIEIDLAEWDRRLNSDPRLAAALRDVQLGTVGEIFGQFAGRGEDLKPWLADAQINTDISLRLEYLAGLWMWLNVSDQIMAEVRRYTRYPSDELTNDEAFEGEIRLRLGLPASGP